MRLSKCFSFPMHMYCQEQLWIVYASFCGMYVYTVWLAMIKDSWLRYNIHGFTESTHAICGLEFLSTWGSKMAKAHDCRSPLSIHTEAY